MVAVNGTKTKRTDAEEECRQLIKRANEIGGGKLNFGAEVLTNGHVYMSVGIVAHVQAFGVADARVLLEEETRKLTTKLAVL